MTPIRRSLGFVVALCFTQTVTGMVCDKPNGYQLFPLSCDVYIRCVNNAATVHTCPFPDLVFSTSAQGCIPKGSPLDDCTGTSPTTVPPPTNPPTPTSTVPAILSGRVVQVRGNISPTSDNSRSEAVCPSGTIVLNCVCTRPGTGCDGTFIAGQNCWAFNALRGPGQQAMGVCLYGDSSRWRTVTSSSSSQPEATCPSGFNVTACTLYNRLGHRGYVRPRLDQTRNSCVADTPCIGSGCSTQAICMVNP